MGGGLSLVFEGVFSPLFQLATNSRDFQPQPHPEAGRLYNVFVTYLE